MADEYTITFKIGDDATGKAPGTATYEEGAVVTLPDSTGFSYAGYTFGGWSSTDGGDAIVAPYEMPGADVTLYAVWSPVDVGTKYVLTFDGNGGTGNPPVGGSFGEGEEVVLPGAGGMVKDGYIFVGWSKTSSGDVVERPFVMPGKNTTLYAIWMDTATYVGKQRTELKRIIDVCIVQIGARGEDYLEGQYVMQVSCDALIRSNKTNKPVRIEYLGYDF